jgi:hypothetical protein
MLTPVDHARWVPESVEGGELMAELPDGTRRLLVSRLRVEASPDGAVRRAVDLLPQSRPAAASLALPERLGGGHVFATSSGGTNLWRAREFLGTLEPLSRVSTSPVQVTAGPDRLILRALTSDRVVGVDPDTGNVGAALPLPIAPRFGPMAFIDGFRGMVWADLQGLMVTSDAGSSWRRVAMPDAPRVIRVEGDAFVALVQGGARYRYDGGGNAVLEQLEPQPGHAADAASAASAAPAPLRAPRGAFGERPLRAAIEDGWPLPDESAIVMRAGRVGRVRLDDGKLLEQSAQPAPGEDDATCQAVRYGVDVGFVCGAPGGGTSLYAWEPPLDARLVTRWQSPRAVMPSQNGWLVVRGGCAPDAPASQASGASAYCVLGPGGASREIFTRGDVGVERVVALSDGRVAVLVPPRGGTEGLLTLLPPGTGSGGSAPVTVRLELPDVPLLRRGLWLDGMVESEPETIAGWVEAGGVIMGLRVGTRDGAVTASKGRDEPLIVVSGQQAVAVQPPDNVSETQDGGFTWQSVAMPPNLGQGRLGRGPRCGPVGCVVAFDRATWLRVGWGPPANPTDLEEAIDPRLAPGERVHPRSISLTCTIDRLEGPRDDEGEQRRGAAARKGDPAPLPAFLGAPPPVIPQGSNALVEHTHSGLSSRLYAWAPKGVALARSARYQGRFYDRYDTARGVRSTALSIAPWNDEQAMNDAMGGGTLSVVFHGFLDPGGKAALLSGCHGGGRERCDLYGLVEGRAIVPLPALPAEAPPGRIMWPSSSAIWFDEAWYVAQNAGPFVNVFRMDAASARLVARFPRATNGGSGSMPAVLVKRAVGRGLGLLARGVGTFGESDQDFYVLPFDPLTGEAGEIVRLLPTDFGSAALARCAPEQDGWLVDVTPGTSVLIRLPGGRVSDAEMRVRLDPGQVCIDGIAARLQDAPDDRTRGARAPGKAPDDKGAGKPREAGRSIPLVATGTAGRRLIAQCHSR